MKASGILRHCSRVLVSAGVLLLTGCLIFIARGYVFRLYEERMLAGIVQAGTSAPRNGHDSEPTAAELIPKTGTVLGELQIPRVGIDTIVIEGDDDDILRLGAGHIPETALPDQAVGNVGIAAHRDTYFRPLRLIRARDLIVLKTPQGNYRYRVLSTQVVEPEDVAVLDNTGQRVLTLVTCYPFYFVGSAPHRFIVRAAAVG